MSHAPSTPAGTGPSAEAARAEEEEKTAISVASNSPARIFIQGHPSSIIILSVRLINMDRKRWSRSLRVIRRPIRLLIGCGNHERESWNDDLPRLGGAVPCR